MQLPTEQQYKDYRAYRRLAVHRIVDCLQGKTIGWTDWTKETIARLRREHSASIARQHTFGCKEG